MTEYAAIIPIVIVALAGMFAMLAEAFRQPGDRMPIAGLGLIGLVGAAIASISSRKSVPPSASSIFPPRLWTAPVKAPFSYPNSSLSSNVSGKAPQLMATNCLFLRRLRL